MHRKKNHSTDWHCGGYSSWSQDPATAARTRVSPAGPRIPVTVSGPRIPVTGACTRVTPTGPSAAGPRITVTVSESTEIGTFLALWLIYKPCDM